MSIELITLMLFACVFVFMAAGMPISFAMGATAVVFCLAFWGIDRVFIMAVAVLSNIGNVNLIAIPLFILMGWIIYKSGVAEDLFDAMYAWLGNIRGGLSMGTIFIGAVFGAICGDMVAGLFTLTTISFTQLMKRGYDKSLAIPSVMCGGLLSFLVPPSILMIVYCSVTNQSIGKLYLGCFIPGCILALIYVVYQLIITSRKPELAPVASGFAGAGGRPSATGGIERPGAVFPQDVLSDARMDLNATGEIAIAAINAPEWRINWSTRFFKLKGVIMPLGLILAMLAGIYTGMFTPMEASAVGVAGAFLIAAIKNRLNWTVTWEAISMTVRLTSMIGWMIMCCGAFTYVYYGMGAGDLAVRVATAVPGGGLLTIIVINIILIVLGMVMDATPLVLIFGPIFTTVAVELGFDPIWFGVVFVVNICCGLLSPPYGFALFIEKAALANLPEQYGITIQEIMRSSIPYCLAHVVLIIILLLLPTLATWLPNLLIG